MRRVLLMCCVVIAFASANAALDARIAARYKQMLASQPAEGVALDRLWQMYAEQGATADLLDEYAKARDSFAGAMVYGHLLQKAGRDAEARAEFTHAAKLDQKDPLPHL